MKIKFTGVNDLTEITVRGVTFKKGVAVDVKDEELAAKVLALDYFTKARAKSNDKNVH